MNSVFVLCVPNWEYECAGCIDVIAIYESKVMAEKEEARIDDLYKRYQATYHAIRTQFPNRLLDGLSGPEGALAIVKHREECAIVDKEIKAMVDSYNKELNVAGRNIGQMSDLTILVMPLIMGE